MKKQKYDMTDQLNAAHIATFRYWRELWCHQHIINLSQMKLEKSSQLSKYSIDGDVLVIGAGPSLNNSLDEIRSFNGLKISSTHSLKLLLENCIKPEVVIIIDAGDRIHAHLEGLDVSDLDLWAYSWVRPDVCTRFKSIKWAFDASSPFWPVGALSVPSHATCAHVAAKISILLGASKVYLVGCDMAFTDGISHWHGNDERDYEIVRNVESIKGGRVGQSAHFAIMKEHWDYLANLHKGTIVNCTRSGARIKGAEHTSLEDIIKKNDCKFDMKKNNSEDVNIDAMISAKQDIWGGPISFKTVMSHQEFAFLMDEKYVGFSLDRKSGSFNVELKLSPGFRMNAIDCADRMLGLSINAEREFESRK